VLTFVPYSIAMVLRRLEPRCSLAGSSRRCVITLPGISHDLHRFFGVRSAMRENETVANRCLREVENFYV